VHQRCLKLRAEFVKRSKNINIKIYGSVILPDVLYGCKTWSLTLRVELRLRVFENRVLRELFGTKRDEVNGSGEKYVMRSLMICTAHKYYSGKQIKKNGMGWACGKCGDRIGAYRTLEGRPDGKKTLRRPRHR